MFTIIIILIVLLVVAAIFINAYQQHRAKIEAEQRAEVAKQRTIVDETENVIMACANMPVSQRLMAILQQRVVNALKVINEHNNTSDVKQRIKDASQQPSPDEADSNSPSLNEFTLPDSDKLIIQYIQAVKKLRMILRSEHTKNKVDTKTYVEEERHLERLQLKINVETLVRRGRSALSSGMLGSARQYFEKAILALENQTNPDEYTISRLASLKESLSDIQNNLKSANAEDRAKRKEQERDELDELFAPKKKW